MAVATKREALPESVEKKLVADVEKAFANESAEFRAAAVIWGRKQFKFQRGQRATKPPVPPKLQGSTREKTQATLVRVANAIGAKIEEETTTSKRTFDLAPVDAEKKSAPAAAAPAKAAAKKSAPAKAKTTSTKRSSAKSAVKAA